MIGRKGRRSEEEGKERKKKVLDKVTLGGYLKKYLLPCSFIGVAQLWNKHTAQQKVSKNSRQCQYCCSQVLLNMDRQTVLFGRKDLGVSEHDRGASTLILGSNSREN